MEALFASVTSLIVFAVGASIGSFLNVVVYRLPAHLSILWPPSRCPHCLHQLGKQENIPILGWLWLRGRCRHCKSQISWRYPLVEAVTGILFLRVFWQFSFSWQTLGYWVFLSWLLTLCLIDLDTMTLPDPLTKSGLILGFVFQAIIGLTPELSGSRFATQLMLGVFGAVLGIWLLDTFRVVCTIAFGREAMGGGDPYLGAMMGAWLGWKYFLIALLLASFIGLLGGVGAIASGRRRWRQRLPFGPLLALGSGLTVFWGEAILSAYSAYLRLFFP